MTPRKPRRIPRADKRAAFWEKAVASAPTGRQALDALFDWARGELKHIEAIRPQEADSLRRHLALRWMPDVRALARTRAEPVPGHANGAPRPPRRTRPLQPAEPAAWQRGEEIPRPEGPLTRLRRGERRP